MSQPPAPELIPAARLGRLLTQSREARDQSIAEVAATDSLISAGFLSELEAGEAEMTEPLLATVARAYGVDVAKLIPPREALRIDLSSRTIAAGGEETELDSMRARRVLGRYLALVYTLRAHDVSRPVALREADVDTLAEALGSRRVTVHRQLLQVMADGSADTEARRIGHRMIVPAAGVLVAATAAGALILLPRSRSDADSTQRSETPDELSGEVGLIPPLIQERDADPVAAGEAGLIEPLVEDRDGAVIPPLVEEAESQLLPPLIIERD